MISAETIERRSVEPPTPQVGGWRSAMAGADVMRADVARADVARADVARVGRETSALELTIATLTAEMTRLGERSRGATLALATLLGALASEIRSIGNQLGNAERVRRLESMRGDLQARVEQLGGVIAPDGQILSFPTADPSLVGELTRLMAELSSALAELRALILRLRAMG